MVELLNEPFGDMPASTLTLVCTATFTCVLAGWRCPASRARLSSVCRMEFSPEIATLSDRSCWACVDDLIDAACADQHRRAKRFFRWQKCNCRTAARSLFLDLVGRGELETIRPVPMQARRVQIMVARNLCHRLAASEAAVDFRALEMLTCATISTHICSEAGES